MGWTPISDFITEYSSSGTVRLHMPGHKGKAVLGCETSDITEISGADALYEADGIIAKSEALATELFDTGRTVYGTEGSSQCIRAMLELAIRHWRKKGGEKRFSRPVVVAARNVHKAFLYAAVLMDLDIVWLWPKEQDSLCSCSVDMEELENALSEHGDRVAAVYVTSPNYLGGSVDISAMAKICHGHDTLFLVDNAHGAYLRFLEGVHHPMDLGADLCCDSAHKTLPVLTGGAYLHAGKTTPEWMQKQMKAAMELFGSTSPSYLILQSLDRCNAYLADGYRDLLKAFCHSLYEAKEQIRKQGWQVEETDPLKLTIKVPVGLRGADLAELLRRQKVECEYADEDFLVLMATPENSPEELEHLCKALGQNDREYEMKEIPLVRHTDSVLPVREAYFSEGEVCPADRAEGRICRMPMAACPPAIPIVVPGERIGKEAVECMRYYGIETIDVIKEWKEDETYGKGNF